MVWVGSRQLKFCFKSNLTLNPFFEFVNYVYSHFITLSIDAAPLFIGHYTVIFLFGFECIFFLIGKWSMFEL